MPHLFLYVASFLGNGKYPLAFITSTIFRHLGVVVSNYSLESTTPISYMNFFSLLALKQLPLGTPSLVVVFCACFASEIWNDGLLAS